MAVLPEDLAQYQAFVKAQATALCCLEVLPEEILWHYTTGDSLLSIIESGTLYATQVSCLNDTTETRYSARMLQEAFVNIRQKNDNDAETHRFLDQLIAAPLDPASTAPSFWFVSCFSKNGDDLSQWRAYSGGENGYAIGFLAKGLFRLDSLVVRINYDKTQHKAVAEEVAKATVRFFREGLEKRPAPPVDEWVRDFSLAWFNCLDNLSPMVKDEGFSGEQEYRIIHQLQMNELRQIRLRQRATLMSRHLPLIFPTQNVTDPQMLPMLPITQVKIGPCRHKEITRISVDTLLVNKGYGTGLVSASSIPFQQL